MAGTQEMDRYKGARFGVTKEASSGPGFRFHLFYTPVMFPGTSQSPIYKGLDKSYLTGQF